MERQIIPPILGHFGRVILKEPSSVDKPCVFEWRDGSEAWFPELSSLRKNVAHGLMYSIGSFACCQNSSSIFQITLAATILAQMPLSQLSTTTTSASSTTTTSVTLITSSAAATTTGSPSSSRLTHACRMAEAGSWPISSTSPRRPVRGRPITSSRWPIGSASGNR